MGSPTSDGGPAFPVFYVDEPGMSLKAYIATRAMQSFIQADPPDAATPMGKYAEEVAASAVVMADALIAKLGKAVSA